MNKPTKATRDRTRAEAAYKASPTKRRLQALKRTSEIEMAEVLRAFDARNL